MMNNPSFSELVLMTVSHECLKKLVFSRPVSGEIKKVSCRLVAHRGKRLLAMEYSLPGDTVSHKNVPEADISAAVSELLTQYKQANLLTTVGDAEYKLSKSGSEVVLGGSALGRRLSGDKPDFESAIEALDNKKNYILSGKEKFLVRLGISSAEGRIHDKKQGKFRQINRFLEHLSDVYSRLPEDGELTVYDLCCGKSYLSFAVYYYLTEIKGRKVNMVGADLKRDVIVWCENLAGELGYTGMKFFVGDISELDLGGAADLVISLHACDIATDIVLENAIRLEAKVILSTPCCHRYLKDRISCDSLSFVTDEPHISVKLCEALTDALRVLRLSAAGYTVSAVELTDPENTPKNTLIKALKNPRVSREALMDAKERYEGAKRFILGDAAEDYLKGIV